MTVGMQVESGHQSDPGVWLSLSTILDLPLEAKDLAVVWREILQRHASPASPLETLATTRLREALRELELGWAIELCKQGNWTAGLSKLEGLEDGADFDQVVRREILALLPDLHYQLVDLAEESPSRCPFSEAERAELLWSCHNWLVKLNASGLEQPERMGAIHEQIYRYGALAWMPLESPLANRRSLRLLLALSEVNPIAHAWTQPAYAERLERELGALQAMVDVAPPSTELINHLHGLIHLCQRFAEVFQTEETREETTEATNDASRKLLQTLRDAKSCLEVWAQLKLA